MSLLGITGPMGFRAASTTAGIKASGKPDMCLVVNDGPRDVAAGVFTRNKIRAAPVEVTTANISDGHLRAVVFNAGNANACTGEQGIEDARDMASAVSSHVNCDPHDVAVCSTGIIGDHLPMECVNAGIDALSRGIDSTNASSDDAGTAAAEAIMTTDTVPKQAGYVGEGWRIGAMVKGVGMISPSLATMLCCITTDAVVDADTARDALRAAALTTFDRLDIDGSTSTNDTALLLSSGASGVSPSQEEFADALCQVCNDLASQMQGDAEGVTKRVSIKVTGAANDSEALLAARTIGRDNLTKCAMFGSDPNWGRVLAAVGIADVEMDPHGISVSFNDHVVCRNSAAVEGSRDVDISGPDISVAVDLSTGRQGEATVRTTDLSFSYVEINSAYTT